MPPVLGQQQSSCWSALVPSSTEAPVKARAICGSQELAARDRNADSAAARERNVCARRDGEGDGGTAGTWRHLHNQKRHVEQRAENEERGLGLRAS